MIYWILLLVFAIPVIGNRRNIKKELREEFHALAVYRLEELLHHSSHLEPYLTLTIRIADCRLNATSSLPRVFKQFRQTILEEEVCATWRMREWCAQSPVRSGLMTVNSYTTNRTAVVDFQCQFSKNHRKHYDFDQVFLDRAANILVVVMFIGMSICWYLTCRRPAPIHPSKILNLNPNSTESDSFESVTFNTTQNRSRVSVANRSNYSSKPKKFRIIV